MQTISAGVAGLSLVCALPCLAQKQAAGAQTAAGAIIYYFPETRASLEAKVRLKSCAKFDVEVELTMTAKAVPDLTAPRLFAPAALASWRQARAFSVEVNGSGTLAGINSTSEDKSGAILGNIVKAVASLVTVGILSDNGDGMAIGRCNAATVRAINRAKVLRDQIVKLRPEAWDGKAIPVETAKELELANAMVAELAAIEAGPLTVTTAIEVPLPPRVVHGQDVALTTSWPDKPFEKWVTGSGTVPPALSAVRIVGRAAALPPSVLPAKACKRSFETPQPALVAFVAKPGTEEKVLLRAPVQQWGRTAMLCLDAPVFASRTLNVAFDAFGMTTKFEWKSNARGEAASALLAEAAAQASAAYDKTKPKPDPTATEATKADADLVEQQIRLIQLRACLDTLQAGGSCPK